MQSKILSKRLFFTASVAGVALSLAIIFFLLPDVVVFSSNIKIEPSVNLQLSATTSAEQLEIGLPTRLKIPKIKINAKIDSVGLTSQGAVGVPKGASTAAWFNLSVRPGEVGSAIISGHYGPWKSGGGSVFDNLSKLSKGDKLYIEDDKGREIIFVVREIKKYDFKANVPEVFYLDDGKAHLNLITCEGIWNKIFKSYSKRLVVFTDKE